MPMSEGNLVVSGSGRRPMFSTSSSCFSWNVSGWIVSCFVWGSIVGRGSCRSVAVQVANIEHAGLHESSPIYGVANVLHLDVPILTNAPLDTCRSTHYPVLWRASLRRLSRQPAELQPSKAASKAATAVSRAARITYMLSRLRVQWKTVFTK